ncbi:MAG: PIN domain-containing protein [Actinobacteria bacterium]|nr:PIN domain-containing protein [Actinomycetota bacterium]NCZ77205.1 PIN domain-containing protein [Actinomycetota bacterium]
MSEGRQGISWYFDSSAILKIIFKESNWSQVAQYADEGIYTSRISRLEVLRTVARVAPALRDQSESYLKKCAIVELKPAILKAAEQFDFRIKLKSLDAIHIASALGIQPLINGVISYDRVMVDQAKNLGLTALSPGV